jgi:hypothetical protein
LSGCPIFINFAFVIELDRHIEILLLSNDCVILPGFGGFMAHHVDARRDDSDGCFLPPLRTIGFNPKLTLNDSLLAQSYVEAYDISYPDAVMRIEDEVRELRQHLENDGSYELNDIGILRMNVDGHYEFEPCEAGILTPTLYGLSSFEMRSIADINQELLVQMAAETQSAMPTLAVETQLLAEAGDEDCRETSGSRQVALWRNLAVACIALLVFLLVPAPLANNARLMESKIDTRLLQRIMPKNVTVGEAGVREALAHRSNKLAQTSTGDGEAKTGGQQKSGFTLVLASRVTRRNAASYVEQLQKEGYQQVEVFTRRSNTKVIYGNYKTRGEAYRQLKKMHDKAPFAEAWVMEF